MRGVSIEDPRRCRAQLEEALAMEGPVTFEALARGEPNHERMGLTLFRNIVDEATLGASPSGAVGRVMEKAADEGACFGV